MTTAYTTDHAVGDTVYIVRGDEIKKDVIDQIKITSEGDILYGFEIVSSIYFSFAMNRDPYLWRRQFEIATSKRQAKKLMKAIKEKMILEKIADHENKIQKLKSGIEE